jgi:Protein of unknown function (DUF3168)
LSETSLAFHWVGSELRNDSALMAAATGGVYLNLAPVDTVAPYVLFGRQGGTDVMTVNGVRLFVHILLQIKAVGPSGPGGSFAVLETIANRIDALFKDRRNITLSGGGLLACYREQELEYPDPDVLTGQPWAHLGGVYHLELQGV